MSQQNSMSNLRMTMPQYVTNLTSLCVAVRILKNKSIIVETTVKDHFKRDIRLGKVLSKLVRKYNKISPDIVGTLQNIMKKNETGQKANSWKLIVSSEPSDLRTISTGRGWTSCMNLKDGAFSDTLENVVAAKDMVAYAVDEKGEWLARILLRFDGKGKWWPEGKVYGKPNLIDFKDFEQKVEEWLKDKNILGTKGDFSDYFNSYSDYIHSDEHIEENKGDFDQHHIEECGEYEIELSNKKNINEIKHKFPEITKNDYIEVFDETSKDRVNRLLKEFPEIYINRIYVKLFISLCNFKL
jgi:hypothetical protein